MFLKVAQARTTSKGNVIHKYIQLFQQKQTWLLFDMYVFFFGGGCIQMIGMMKVLYFSPRRLQMNPVAICIWYLKYLSVTFSLT